ncbi:hypothetical protein TRIATDRAFT_256469 [Trichoderma atroviride IMI 206040]|uniref:Uncharacterized protein n=1 Tax=Hypocrea atroviridis (strain ATCC 20476 / IMI 206040) TaxID=452589 RepID=G9NSW1_HYPAI|nr:uncharacterized protein TRIATDRAFT_256469 [Trichoderma atroviride IMI 206040]EHK46505.1 hypothetical protein TRIATDRAFT_256469 [Trichoderma atroviride IMI 206040]
MKFPVFFTNAGVERLAPGDAKKQGPGFARIGSAVHILHEDPGLGWSENMLYSVSENGFTLVVPLCYC